MCRRFPVAFPQVSRSFWPFPVRKSVSSAWTLGRFPSVTFRTSVFPPASARAAELGARACARFRELGERLPGTVREVRGKGLIIGVELALDDDICRKVWERLLEKGFVLNLTYGKTLRLLPPLNIEEADLEHFTEALEETLKELV